MNRGVDRQAIFFADADRVEFGRLLAVMCDEDGLEVHAYCLMSNHYHLLVHAPDGGLSAALHRLSSVFVRHVNDRVGRDGPLFRGRFTSRSIVDEADIVNVVRYIHRNPLVIAGVTSPADYRWSSHRTYLGARARPPWMQIATVLGWFGDDPTEFARFVESDDDITTSGSVVLAAEQLLVAIDLMIAERSNSRPGQRRSEARCVALLTADRLHPTNRDEVHRALGLSGPETLRIARWRARRLADQRPDLAEVGVDATQLALRRTRRVTSGAWHQM